MRLAWDSIARSTRQQWLVDGLIPSHSASVENKVLIDSFFPKFSSSEPESSLLFFRCVPNQNISWLEWLVPISHQAGRVPSIVALATTFRSGQPFYDAGCPVSPQFAHFSWFLSFPELTVHFPGSWVWTHLTPLYIRLHLELVCPAVCGHRVCLSWGSRYHMRSYVR